MNESTDVDNAGYAPVLGLALHCGWRGRASWFYQLVGAVSSVGDIEQLDARSTWEEPMSQSVRWVLLTLVDSDYLAQYT